MSTTISQDILNDIRTSSHYLGGEQFDASQYKWDAGNANSHVLVHTDANRDNEPVTLTCITHITAQDYWLTSCGMWRGPSSVASTFAAVKPSCTGAHPAQSGISDDFSRVLTNVKSLCRKAHTGAASQNKGLLVSWVPTETKIRFRHHLFTPITPENDEEDYLDSSLTLENWPVIHPDAREALATMRNERTHRVNPLPAYDINGDLIRPSQYRMQLQGAVVRMDFSLTHWDISNKHLFAADIDAVRVLAPPATPALKRKQLYSTDPGPSKKMKTV